MSPAPPKWGRAPSRDPLLSKEPKEQTSSTCPFLTSPKQPFLLLPLLFLFTHTCLFLHLLVILPCRCTCLSVQCFLKENLFIPTSQEFILCFFLAFPKRLWNQHLDLQPPSSSKCLQLDIHTVPSTSAATRPSTFGVCLPNIQITRNLPPHPPHPLKQYCAKVLSVS